MSTGDFRNNLFKVETELKSIQYPCRLNAFGVAKGDPAALLPILHYTLLDYSSLLAAHFAAKGYELYGKKDSRFLEAVYGLLRKEFSYRPQMTRQQFFNMGYAERKLIFLFDVIQACKTLHKNLSKTSKNKNIKKKTTSSDNPSSDTIKKVDTTTESSPKNSFRLLEERQRSYSPEIALASLWERKKLFSPSRHGKNTPTPFPNPLDTYHHEYHDLPFAKGIGAKYSTIECESIMNHPPSYAFKAYIPGNYDSARDRTSPPKLQNDYILSDLEGVKISESPIPKIIYNSPPKHQNSGGPIAFSSPSSKKGYKGISFIDDDIIEEKSPEKKSDFVTDRSIQTMEVDNLSRSKEDELNSLKDRIKDLESQLEIYASKSVASAFCQTTGDNSNDIYKITRNLKKSSVQELLAKPNRNDTMKPTLSATAMNNEFQLAVINYPLEYSELIKSFNALQDPTIDGLETMQKILENYNPAHYTIWKRRWEFITSLDYDLDSELEWINTLLLDNPKTYQIWNYRQKLISLKNDAGNEFLVLNEILLDDSKNYHAWSYRQWLIKKFNITDGELEYTADLINQDVYNNSAWNHRYFLLSLLKVDICQELEYVRQMISQYPDNESPWNYYRALVSEPGTNDFQFVKYFPSNKFAVYTLFQWTKDSSLLEKLSEIDHKRSNFWINFPKK